MLRIAPLFRSANRLCSLPVMVSPQVRNMAQVMVTLSSYFLFFVIDYHSFTKLNLQRFFKIRKQKKKPANTVGIINEKWYSPTTYLFLSLILQIFATTYLFLLLILQIFATQCYNTLTSTSTITKSTLLYYLVVCSKPSVSRCSMKLFQLDCLLISILILCIKCMMYCV